MDVLDTARELGLLAENETQPVGGIAEELVLHALEKLAVNHPDSSDLFTQAALRVQLGRSAGLEHVAADSVFARHGTARAEQFRYRAEMGEVFIDLAIDLGGREPDVDPIDALEAGLVAQG